MANLTQPLAARLAQEEARWIATLGFAFALGACTAPDTVDRADALAKAGIAYAEVAPTAIDEAHAIKVEGSAVTLAAERELRGTADKAGLEQRMAINDRQLAEQRAALSDVKRHNALLREYFVALRGLTQSSATADAAQATQGIVQQLSSIGQTIIGAPATGAAIVSKLPQVMELVVASRQAQAIKAELRAHGELIERELALQEAAMLFLKEQSENELVNIRESRRKVIIDDPYFAHGALPAEWPATYASVTLDDHQASAVAHAANAAAELRKTWIAFVQGSASIPQIEALIGQIDRLAGLLSVRA